MRLDDWYSRFCKEKQPLNNSSTNTIRFYESSYTAYKKAVGETIPDKVMVNEFIFKMRERVRPSACNT
jgi:hydrogenase maturation factor HypE